MNTQNQSKKTVTMVFPKPVTIHISHADNQSAFFPAGVNEVPEELSTHWYLKANGVTAYKPAASGAAETAQAPVSTESTSETASQDAPEAPASTSDPTVQAVSDELAAESAANRANRRPKNGR